MGILKQLVCKHNYKFVRNLHGDEIINHGWKRSEWECCKCGKIKYKAGLY